MADLFLGTNKQGLIVYNGESSADYGMVVSEAPEFERPRRKQTVFSVPGRNGDVVYQEDAWDDVVRSYSVWLSRSKTVDLAKTVNAFSAWLNSQKGYLRLEDSFETDIFRLAYYSGGNDISNELMQYGETKLTFTCRPERFLKEGAEPIRCELDNQAKTFFNPTRFTAKPLIKIGFSSGTYSNYGVVWNPTTTLTPLFKLNGTFSGIITIDSETQDVIGPAGENLNSCFEGEFPMFTPGQIYFKADTTSLTSLEVIPRYFTI